MYLCRLKAQGFRCLYQVAPTSSEPELRDDARAFDDEPGVEVQLDRLTVLIGCNDAGKSSVLDALDIVLNDGRPDIEDFHCFPDAFSADEDAAGANRLGEIKVLIEFRLEEERDTEAAKFAVNGMFTVRATYAPSGSGMAYWGETPQDERLAQDFGKLKAPEQRELVRDIDPSVLEELSNSEQRVEWLTRKALAGPQKCQWIPVPRGFTRLLPRFERYNTMDYNAPENLAMKTLRQVYDGVIFEEVESDGSKTRRPVKALRDLRSQVESGIREKVQELRTYIERYNPRVRDISFDPTLDFSGGLRAGQFQIDDGHGPMYLSKVGDGTKRRFFMAVLDWDREVTVAQAATGSVLPSIMRGYDEPDTNLDYEAQRRMYRSISDIAESENSRVQALIWTHSPRLIDRAPAQSIRLLHWNEGCTSISQLQTGGDREVERFLAGLARDLGLSNTLMFYESCFILIEGATEENALPLLYRTAYGHSLLEDGIRTINVQSNGAFLVFLKLLSRNRQDITVVLADLDTERSTAGRRLTTENLHHAHFDPRFLDSHVHYVPEVRVGKNGEEFEAAFSSGVIAQCLEAEWPKKEGKWTPQDIEAIRAVPGKKFSDALKTKVWSIAGDSGSHWTKPGFGIALGSHCPHDEISEEILKLFAHAREIARCN